MARQGLGHRRDRYPDHGHGGAGDNRSRRRSDILSARVSDSVRGQRYCAYAEYVKIVYLLTSEGD